MSKKLLKKDELEAERIAGELVKVHQVDPLTPKEARKLAMACKLFGARLEADPIRFQFQKHDTIENTNDPSE
jgi:hypothetical protein